MNKIKFVISDKLHYDGIQVLIDGVDLLESLGANKFFSYLTMPDFCDSLNKEETFWEYYSPYLYDEDEEADEFKEETDVVNPKKTILFTCNCFIIQCTCLYMKMTKTLDTVVWEGFKSSSGVDYNLIGTLTFDRIDFELELAKLVPEKEA